MKPEWKAKWVTALRSGQYVQTEGCLHEETDTGGAFCCLGVLLDLSDIGHFEGSLYILPEDGEPHNFCEGELESLSPLFGVTGDEQQDLIRMNDEEKKSFAEIADYIEAKL